MTAENIGNTDWRKILILGGARSGKSRYAQELAMNLSEHVVFIATGEAGDEEMQVRITEHIKHRPHSWKTVELPQKIAENLTKFRAKVFLIDCVTLLISNLVRDKNKPEEYEKDVLLEITQLVHYMNSIHAHFILVSNEVGMGIVPENKLARVYRDLLGKANQLLAQHSQEVYLMISGIPLRIK